MKNLSHLNIELNLVTQNQSGTINSLSSKKFINSLINNYDNMSKITILEERQYPTVKDIPYHFLRNKLLSVSKDYTISYVFIGTDGSLVLEIEGRLDKEKAKAIYSSLIPDEYKADLDDKFYEGLYYFKETGVEYTQIALSELDYKML